MIQVAFAAPPILGIMKAMTWYRSSACINCQDRHWILLTPAAPVTDNNWEKVDKAAMPTAINKHNRVSLINESPLERQLTSPCSPSNLWIYNLVLSIDRSYGTCQTGGTTRSVANPPLPLYSRHGLCHCANRFFDAAFAVVEYVKATEAKGASFTLTWPRSASTPGVPAALSGAPQSGFQSFRTASKAQGENCREAEVNSR